MMRIMNPRPIFPLSVEFFKNCPIIRGLLPTKKNSPAFLLAQKCQNVHIFKFSENSSVEMYVNSWKGVVGHESNELRYGT